MNSEVLSIETAEKLANYEKLLLERNNLILYLKNQVSINRKNVKNFLLLKDKNKMLIARSKYSMGMEILKFLKENV